MGLGDGNKIVIYDTTPMTGAARVWWMFRAMGHKDVSILDGGLLQLAAKFLSDDDEDQAAAKKLAVGLKSVLVRSFEFKNDAVYLESDVEMIRSQLHGPDWKKVIETRSRTEGNSDVYLRTSSDRITGFALICAEPKELTVVTVEGNVDIDTFRKLAGNFGIPSSLGRKFEGKNK